MKTFRILAAVCLLPVLLFGCSAERPDAGGAASRGAAASYGVFVGAGPEGLEQMGRYDIVVIDGAYFTAEEIGRLQEQGCTVYSYLNIGSLETFRDIYPEFQAMVLDAYDNWPDEFWMDVSRPEWQAYLVDAAAGDLAEKGVDGFFLDNADVYYQYPTKEIFDGLVQIIGGLAQYGREVVINGGDVFVSRAVLDAREPLRAVTGVNQECVFTGIDFGNGTPASQQPDTTQYYLEYLQQCKEHGLAVYLTEYAPADSHELQEDIRRYCDEQGYLCYIASSVQLDGAN